MLFRRGHLGLSLKGSATFGSEATLFGSRQLFSLDASGILCITTLFLESLLLSNLSFVPFVGLVKLVSFYLGRRSRGLSTRPSTRRSSISWYVRENGGLWCQGSRCQASPHRRQGN
jgi:hypothetical protein